MATSRAKAQAFRDAHGGSVPLVLPTAWDAASARVFEDAGARAIATTSLGVANTLGYADGETHLPFEESHAMARRIVRAVSVPVSVDIEAGYGDPAYAVRAMVEVGAVGINIEDRVGDDSAPLPVAEAADRVAIVRAEADAMGLPLFVNARTDTLLLGGDVTDAIERLNAYLDAGADCTLPVGAADLETIGRIVEEVRGPVNINARLDGPSIPELARIGVRRVSVTVYRGMTGYLQSAAQELLTTGTFEKLRAQRPFPPINDAFREVAP